MNFNEFICDAFLQEKTQNQTFTPWDEGASEHWAKTVGWSVPRLLLWLHVSVGFGSARFKQTLALCLVTSVISEAARRWQPSEQKLSNFKNCHDVNLPSLLWISSRTCDPAAVLFLCSSVETWRHSWFQEVVMSVWQYETRMKTIWPWQGVSCYKK